MGVPERRRRLLFRAQAGVGVLGVLGVLVVGLSLIVIFEMPTGIWSLVGILALGAIAAVAGGAWWALLVLERSKFDAVAVPNVDWAQELRAVRDSRRVIVAAFEIERKRIERDLHDGAQQYLVAATMKLGEAGLIVEQDHPDNTNRSLVAALVEGAHQDAEEALRTLRATVSGIHPQMLSDLGLQAAVNDLAERSGLDVTVRCPHTLPDMPEEVAAVAWFFCSEALTNVAKHAPNATATLLLTADQELHASVVDDGPGGAYLRARGGLAGMRERLAAFGGAMELSSPPGGPTTVTARMPLLLAPASEGEDAR